MGTGWTLLTALAAWAIALVLGSLVGVARTTPFFWLARLGEAYVELFRNIPLLVQMFLWYFVLPEVLPTDIGDWLKQLPDASFYTAVVSLGFYTSARVSEQVRAGILSLARGQRFAGLALGLSLPQTYLYALLPPPRGGSVVPGVRGLHRRDRHLHHHQHRGDLRHALGRAASRRARSH